jgi:hypothetical protein
MPWWTIFFAAGAADKLTGLKPMRGLLFLLCIAGLLLVAGLGARLERERVPPPVPTPTNEAVLQIWTDTCVDGNRPTPELIAACRLRAERMMTGETK